MGGIIFGLLLAGFGVFVVFDVKKNGVNPETGKAKMLVKILGRKGAGIFYTILGYICLFAGAGAAVSAGADFFLGK